MKINGLQVAGILLTFMAFLLWVMTDHWLVIVLFGAGLICFFIDAWKQDSYEGMISLVVITLGAVLMTIASSFFAPFSVASTICTTVGGLLTIGGLLYVFYRTITQDIVHDKQLWQSFKGRKRK